MKGFRLPPSSEEALARLLTEKWQRIWTQGGVFDFVKPVANSVYVVPSLVIECLSLVQIAAFAVEQSDGSEVYPVSLGELSEIGTAESERYWKPSRKPVTKYPDGLDLRPFFQTEISVSILINRDVDGGLFDGVLFETDGNRLLVVSSVEIPESLIVSRYKEYIEQVLQERERQKVM
jgi:hypothetical protein